jgi:FkbH-like protein
MVLKLGDFASFHASWDRKPERLRQMARELNLGLDSFVFFDDNPAERALMRAELPEVLVVEVPADPSGYIAAIEQSLAFETNLLGEADKARSAQYAAEALRQSEIVKAASPESYLASLQMEASVEQITDANIARVSDLVTKTNQFNLTTRRHSKAAIEAMVSSPESLCFAVRLSDRFGDYGLVAVVLGAPEAPGELRLDTWLMSCRAMGRTLEHFTFNHLTRTAVSAGYERIVAEYLPTTKNEPVKSLLADFGFEELPNTSGLQTLQLKDIHEASTQVKPTEKAP